MPEDEATFDDLPIAERAREAAHHLGWRAPTPIQRLVIPQLAAGRDVIGRAETGSGKTGAFGLVLTDAVRQPGLRAIVLAPTRELVLQIASDLNAMARDAPFRAVPVYGGVPLEPQIEALMDPAITCVVATTGRLIDILSRHKGLLREVEWVVIDEADRMLDMGFLPDVERVLMDVPNRGQRALFTATMPKKIQQLAHKYLAHPREVEVGPAAPASLEHYRLDVPSVKKREAFIAWVRQEQPARALVFVRTRESAPQLARELQSAGVPAVAFHGDMDQQARERVVEELRSGGVPIVVATDVAARGLDIQGITHVVNYDVPEEADAYVHRAGRTARAGKRGKVFTFVTENDGAHAQAAEKAAGVRMLSYVLRVVEDGEEVRLTRAPVPPQAVRRGGNARGVKRKRAPQQSRTPMARDPARASKDDDANGPEFKLPPSRRERAPPRDDD